MKKVFCALTFPTVRAGLIVIGRVGVLLQYVGSDDRGSDVEWPKLEGQSIIRSAGDERLPSSSTGQTASQVQLPGAYRLRS